MADDVGGKSVMNAQMERRHLKNPYLSFSFTGAAKGDEVKKITWSRGRGLKPGRWRFRNSHHQGLETEPLPGGPPLGPTQDHNQRTSLGGRCHVEETFALPSRSPSPALAYIPAGCRKKSLQTLIDGTQSPYLS